MTADTRTTPPPRRGRLSRPRIDALAARLQGWRRTIASLAAFGGVGAVAFVVDVGVYNILRATLLEGSPIWSKVVSVAVATAVAWIGNRLFAFRSTRRGNVVREAALFALMNVGGLLIAAACLFISHYLLGFTSQLADNVAGNGVGLVLGTAFRYLGYRFVVFRGDETTAPGTPVTDEATRRQDASSHPMPAQTRTPQTGDPQWRGIAPAGVGTRTRPPHPVFTASATSPEGSR